MFSTKLSALALAALSTPAFAGEWWMLGYQTHFCSNIQEGDSWYSWRDTSEGCHNFGDNSGTCLWTENTEGSLGVAKECAGNTPPYQPLFINSVGYFDGIDNSDTGCFFYDEPDCGGGVTPVDRFDLTSGCYEFDNMKKSFMCP